MDSEEPIWEYSGTVNVPVKFRISEKEVVEQEYSECVSIKEIKNDIARKFEVSPEYLVVCFNRRELMDDIRIYELQTLDSESIEFHLKISQRVLQNDFLAQPKLSRQTFEKNVESIANKATKILHVQIENKAIKKPNIGGYYDHKKGIKYENAFTQTGPPLEKMKSNGIVSRKVQTKEVQTKNINTKSDHSTQAFGEATELAHSTTLNEKTLTPRKYESSEEKIVRERKYSKILLIQRNLRRTLLQRLIKNAAREYRCLVQEQKFRENKVAENLKNFRDSCTAKEFPKTKEDFDLLIAQVKRWKKTETKRINEMYSGGPRVAELSCLLDKEIQLLNGIERRKTLVVTKLRESQYEKQLRKLGNPIRWVGYKDMIIEMDLIRTQKIREFLSIYDQLKNVFVKEKRIEILEQITNVLMKEQITPSICELIDLFDREKKLLLEFKLDDDAIVGLRKRENLLFPDVIKAYDRYEKLPQILCDICKELKPEKYFALCTREGNQTICRKCTELKTQTCDKHVYKRILRVIQRDERRRGAFSSYAFIIQEDDIQFLVNNIWHGHSILTQNSDIINLRLPRWIMSEDWAPWNCVCLTEPESRAHVKLININDSYSESLIKDVRNKNILAKSAFSRIEEIDADFVESNEWLTVGGVKE